MPTTFRPGAVDDAKVCGTICYEAFKTIAEQHNFPPDFPSAEIAVGVLTMVLSRSDVFSVVAERDGHVIGSNFLWEGDTIAGVGPITVLPSSQNSSIGRQLMERVLDRAHAKRQAGVRLVQAAYHNRSLSLYSKLGFDGREALSTVQGSPIRVEVPGHVVRAADEDDLEACNKLCLAVHGHDRGLELLHAVKQGAATVVIHKGRITGYATTVGFFGHAVGESNEDLKALIGAATEFPGPGFLLPTRNSDLLRWCLANGLRIVQPMMLMAMGQYKDPQGAFLPSVIY